MKTSHRFIAVAIVLASIHTTSAQTKGSKSGQLRIDVADAAENAPIQYAFVLIHSDYGKKDVAPQLDANGRSNVLLTPGVYDVFVSAAGFAPMCKTIEISGHATTFRARLKPDRGHLQSALGSSKGLS